MKFAETPGNIHTCTEKTKKLMKTPMYHQKHIQDAGSYLQSQDSQSFAHTDGKLNYRHLRIRYVQCSYYKLHVDHL